MFNNFFSTCGFSKSNWYINLIEVVNKAKTTGEPPLMLAMSVFFAIKDAIASTSNYRKIPNLDAPATPEKILLSISRLKKINYE